MDPGAADEMKKYILGFFLCALVAYILTIIVTSKPKSTGSNTSNTSSTGSATSSSTTTTSTSN